MRRCNTTDTEKWPKQGNATRQNRSFVGLVCGGREKKVKNRGLKCRVTSTGKIRRPRSGGEYVAEF